MDTSMEDLFSDCDKSTAPVDSEKKKENTEKQKPVVSITETLRNETIKIEGTYQTAAQSLQLTIELLKDSVSTGCINLEIHYPTADNNKINTQTLPIHICILCEQKTFINILSHYSRSSAGLVSSDFSTSFTYSSIFPCSKRFINILCNIVEEDSVSTPDLIRLFSLPNGIVYAIWYSEVTKQLHCSIAFLLSTCQSSIVTWAFIYNPVNKSISSSYTTSGGNSSAQNEKNTVNDLLIGLTKDGQGVGVWFDSACIDCEKKNLNITEFNLPKPPDPITKCRTQASWLHIITQSGHLISVHFSLQLPSTMTRTMPTTVCDDFNNTSNSKSTKWRLICQPTNFPRLPIHLAPVDSVDQWIKSCPRWRDLRICGFSRLPDGHLGCVNSNGYKTRLIDVVSKAENSFQIADIHNEESQQLFASLVKTQHEMKIYIACLYLLLNYMNNENCQAPSTPLLDCNIYLTHMMTRGHDDDDEYQSNPSSLDLIVDISMLNAITDVNIDDLFQSDVTKITPENLASMILFESETKDKKKNQMISEYLQQYLYIVFTIDIVKDDCELSAVSSPSSTLKDSASDEDIDVINDSFIYTHKEPWFGDRKNTSSPRCRRFKLPHKWMQIFHVPNNSSESLLPPPPPITHNNICFKVQVQLEFQSPMLPSIRFEQSNSPRIFHTREFHNSSPIIVNIGSRLFDWIHLLYEQRRRNILKTPVELTKSTPIMHINVTDSVLKSIISDALKLSSLSSSSSSKSRDDFLKSIITNDHCLLYSCLTKQSVQLQWSVYLDLDNSVIDNEDNDNNINTTTTTTSTNNNTITGSSIWCCTISSNCLKTLWLTYKAIELRQQISKQNNPMETLKPSVEQLRLECCILKKLLTSLKNFKSDSENLLTSTSSSSSLSQEEKMMMNFLLDSFSILRKTASSSLLYSNKKSSI